MATKMYSLPTYDGYSGGTEGKNDKMGTVMAFISLGVNALAIVMGIVLLILSFFFLYNSVSMTGIVISVMVVIAGLIGISDTVLFRSIQVKVLYMVGLVLLITMVFSFNNQVDFVVADDCAKAELFLRVTGVQETVRRMKTEDMMLNVLTRMKEMEDMMDMLSTDVDSSNMKELGLDSKEEKFLLDVDDFIRMKLNHLHKHATEIMDIMDKTLEDIKKDSQQQKQDKLAGKFVDQGDVELLRQMEKDLKIKIDRLQSTLQYIENKREHVDLTAEDYQKLLDIMNEGSDYEHPGIKKEVEDAHKVVSAIEQKKMLTKKANAAQGGSGVVDFSDWKLGLEDRNKRLEDFWRLFQENRQAQKFHEEAIEQLPDHCLAEYGSEPYINLLCWGIIICLGLGMYIMCSAAFMQVAAKKNY
eukprot:TRINITY_DN10574_c0_g1_i3.p1 TRINITY_DN10574_c0_g1~~TRINITY_DN10574_c0_g1_i3.p1  ORF type:complete len:414 (-),score=60.77 TRINITY_DN10574_c0_g1_i3:237-1478(-)